MLWQRPHRKLAGVTTDVPDGRGAHHPGGGEPPQAPAIPGKSAWAASHDQIPIKKQDRRVGSLTIYTKGGNTALDTCRVSNYVGSASSMATTQRPFFPQPGQYGGDLPHIMKDDQKYRGRPPWAATHPAAGILCKLCEAAAAAAQYEAVFPPITRYIYVVGGHLQEVSGRARP
jgi:hypothetical protein